MRLLSSCPSLNPASPSIIRWRPSPKSESHPVESNHQPEETCSFSIIPSGFSLALQTLTILPGPQVQNPKMESSLPWIPLVGTVIGLGAYAISYTVQTSPATEAFLITTYLVLVTGGLHLDGLADTCASQLIDRGVFMQFRSIHSGDEARRREAMQSVFLTGMLASKWVARSAFPCRAPNAFCRYYSTQSMTG